MCSKLLSVVHFIFVSRRSVRCFFITPLWFIVCAGNRLWSLICGFNENHTGTAEIHAKNDTHSFWISSASVFWKIKMMRFPKKKLFDFLIFELCLTKVFRQCLVFIWFIWNSISNSSFAVRVCAEISKRISDQNFQYLLINYVADFIAIAQSFLIWWNSHYFRWPFSTNAGGLLENQNFLYFCNIIIWFLEKSSSRCGGIPGQWAETIWIHLLPWNFIGKEFCF